MKIINNKISLGLIALGLGGSVQVAQAAYPYAENLIRVCVHTSNKLDPKITTLLPTSQAVLKATGYNWTWKPSPAMPFKVPTPAPGETKCSGLFGNFNPNVSLGLTWTPALALAANNPACTVSNLVRTAQEIGPGKQEYSVHFSITGANLNGVNGFNGTSTMTSCAVSNVPKD